MSNSQSSNDFREIALNRRSIKAYDPEVKISKEEMSEMLAEATRAPSSVNLQPWRFVVIESEEGKQKLAPLARFNQTQVLTSSAVIAVFADMENIQYADEIFGKAVELGYMPQEVKEAQMPIIKSFYANYSASDLRDVNFIDAGLVSMQLMLVARAHGYDTNPIGGFEKDQIADAFGLDKERYQPIMLISISIGKAAQQGYPSYRLPVETVASWH